MNDLTEDEIRYKKYIDVALKLLTDDSDTSPSARALVDRLGGSLTTANKAMQVFWRYVGRRMSYDNKYPDMPVEVIRIMEKLMATARKAAQAELANEKAKLKAYEDEAENRVTALQVSNESLNSELETSIDEVEKLRQELEAIAYKLEKSDSAVLVLTRQKDALDGEITILKNNLDSADKQFRDLNEEFKSQRIELGVKSSLVIEARGDNNVLQEKINQLRSTKELCRGEIDESRKAIKGFEDRIDELQSNLESSNTQLAKADTEREGQERYIKRLDSELKAITNQKDKLFENMRELESKISELSTVQGVNKELDRQVVDLRKERDQLLVIVGKRPSKIRKPAKN